MKKLVKYVCFFSILISCSKQEIDFEKPYNFLKDEAVQVLKKQIQESKHGRTDSDKKKMFDNPKVNWDSFELETKDGIDMYYFNLYSDTSIDSETNFDKKKNKKPMEFDNFKRIAIKKNNDGSYKSYKMIYLQDKIDKTSKKSGVVKFSGKVLFMDINENFEFGYEYSNGKIVNEIKKESGEKKGARINNCNYYQNFSINVYVYVYTAPNYYNGDYHYSHTNHYSIWISCFNSTGVNSSTIFTGFGNNSGNGSSGFGQDGLVSSAYTGRPYEKSKTFIIKSNECDAFAEAVAKSSTYGIEYNGLVLQGSNGPIYMILPPEHELPYNKYNESIIWNNYSNVSWGQGFTDSFYVTIDLTAKSVLVRLNGLTTAYASYNILSYFHTHPYTATPSPSTDDYAFGFKYPNLNKNIWWQSNGIYQYTSNSISTGTYTGVRNCNN